ncbi:MAG: L-lactate permease, partial [Emergencia timonensis]
AITIRDTVIAWAAMTVSLMVMAEYEMVSVIGFVTGMVGVAVMMVVNRLSDRKERSMADAGQKRRLFASVLPYLLIILLSLTFFVLNPGLEISVSFPGYETLQGAVVEAKPDYVVFNILKYPFTIILLTTIASVIYYCRIGRMERKQTGLILQNTIRKIVPTEITLLFLLCTASIMMDGGMTTILSTGIVELTGSGYPFMASLIGMLGAFITGSNTNSNILFGSLQETAALSLGMEPALMCAVQSIAASVGGTIGPTTTALVAAAAGKSGQEIEIYKYTLLPTIVTAMMLGLTNIIFI